ncbi:hypothetical protein ACHAXR_001266 [Thalassiosira sp. AJA248-18]
MNNKSAKLEFGLCIKNAYGEAVAQVFTSSPCEFEPGRAKSFGFFPNREIIMGYLVNGALVVEVRMKKMVETAAPPPTVFIPENPSACKIVQNMFMDEETADVVFEVGEGEAKDNATKKAKNTPATFYAHRLILQKCNNTLAELCAGGKDSPISIPDVKPDIFQHLLCYVYGGQVSDDDLKSKTKEIVDAADKYGVTNLKLEAEACFVKSTTITVENMIEHLLYADAKNCALLKEAVMDFIVDNKVQVLESVSFQDAPVGPTMITDILAAVARAEKKKGTINEGGEDQFSTMSISDLRRKVHEKGLDIDGSRESLIASLQESP